MILIKVACGQLMRYTLSMQTRTFPRILAVLILAIAVVNCFANAYYWYWQIRWFDMPMHFLGGVWLAGVAIWWRFTSGRCTNEVKSFWRVILWGVGAAFLVGFAWEVYESTISVLTIGHINAIPDTFSDLFFDTLGGFVTACLINVKGNYQSAK